MIIPAFASDDAPSHALGHAPAVAAPMVFPVALAICREYAAPDFVQQTAALMESAGIRPARGSRVLVKPNLLTAQALACTQPAVTAAVCAYFLDCGAQVTVGDSPGFGTASGVARAVGQDEALRPLGLVTRSLDKGVSLRLDNNAVILVSQHALECDVICSVPRVKAHCQVRVTLAVKNLFGCVCGWRKALIHTREGRDPLFFADCLAALWAALPPSVGVVDGVNAMHVTGPSKGQPFALGLLGASNSAVALDEALCAVLGLTLTQTLVGAALERRKAPGCTMAGAQLAYPLLRPENFDVRGFELPESLMHTSFHPMRFVKSCIRRTRAALFS